MPVTTATIVLVLGSGFLRNNKIINLFALLGKHCSTFRPLKFLVKQILSWWYMFGYSVSARHRGTFFPPLTITL